MSVFAYNNINLSLVRTNSVQRTPRMSPDNTEYMWTDFTIDISCIFSPGSTSYPVPGLLPASTDTGLRHLLMQPRRPLIFAEGGVSIVNLLPSLPDGGAIDCENGPTPLSLTINRIGSARIFFVNYVIKVSLIECETGGIGGIASAIATSRYTRSESIDAQYRSTLVTTGLTVFRSNVLAAMAVNADEFRGYIIPQPRRGYRREAVQVTLGTSGTSIEFSTIDREQFVDLGNENTLGTAASIGITTMELVYSAHTLSMGPIAMVGNLGVARVSASAMGTRSANTWDMLQFLFIAATDKLSTVEGIATLRESSAQEDVFNKVVSITLEYLVQTQNEQAVPDAQIAMRNVIGVPIASLPDVGGINPRPPFSQSTRGILGYELAANAFAKACFTAYQDVGIDQTGCIVPSDIFAQPPPAGCFFPQVFVYQSEDVPQSEGIVQQGKGEPRGPNDAKRNGYLNASLRKDVSTSYGSFSMPMAKKPSVLGSPTPTPTPTPEPTPTPVPTSINIQVFQPTTKVVFSGQFERVGAIPEIPKPDVKNETTYDTSNQKPQYTLMDATISPVGIEVAPDGATPIYRLSFVYTYSYSGSIQSSDKIPFDIPPWVKMEQGEFTQIIPSDYKDGILDLYPVDAQNV